MIGFILPKLIESDMLQRVQKTILMSLSGVSDRIHLRTPGTIHSVNHCHINFSLHFILPLFTSQIFDLNDSNAVSQLTVRKEVQSQPQSQFSLFVSPVSPYLSYNSCCSPNRKCSLLTKKVISWVSAYELEYVLQETLVMNTIILLPMCRLGLQEEHKYLLQVLHLIWVCCFQISDLLT